MEIDLSHAIITSLLTFAMVLLFERRGILRDASRLVRGLFLGGFVFVVLVVLELLWPGNGPSG